MPGQDMRLLPVRRDHLLLTPITILHRCFPEGNRIRILMDAKRKYLEEPKDFCIMPFCILLE
ncbi:MAG: hypothetical protein DCC43_09065 [Candidatus Brocadia sp.]|nr:hypothetical protein [Candidatus Brocadia sp. AMX3]RIJ99013.1 MAG: hypothetical protein DCC43_09065 [Candidatus Brocadia sp.]